MFADLLIFLCEAEKKHSEMVPKVGLGAQEIPQFVKSAI